MTEAIFSGDDNDAEEFCRDIAAAMVRLFGVSTEEAIGRIRRQWPDEDLHDAYKWLYRYDEETWAKNIYYDANIHWWLDESSAKPKPWP